MKKVSLTSSQIALAAGSDIAPGIDSDDIETYLEENLEANADTDGDGPPEDADTRDFYEQDRDGDGWLTDELKNYALSYGLKDDDLKQFNSADDLERFGEATDLRQSQSRYQEHQVAEPKKAATEEGETEQEADEDEDDWDVLLAKMEEENYDDASKLLARKGKAQEEKIKAMEERGQADAQAAEEKLVGAELLEFDKALDSTDTALFGKSVDKDGNQVNLSPAFDENRRAVFSEYLRIKQQVADRGDEVPMGILVERARRTTFGGATVSDRVANQSRRRRPTGSNRGQNGGSAPASRSGDDVSAIAQSPKMRAFWEQTQRSNGQV